MRITRPIWFALAVAAIGIGASVAVSQRETRQVDELERLRLEQSVDAQVMLLQEHLSSRATIARAFAAVMRPSGRLDSNMLGAPARQLLALAPDITATAWLPRVRPAEVDSVLDELRQAGVESPRILGPNREILPAAGLDRDLYPILDVEPREPNAMLIGLDAGAFPERRAAIERARSKRQIAAAEPVRLVQTPNAAAIALYAPVYLTAASEEPRGYLMFGYRLDRLIPAAFAASGAMPYAMHIYDGQPGERRLLQSIGARMPADPEAEFAALEKQPNVVRRTVEFGDRVWTVLFVAPLAMLRAGAERGALILMAGLVLSSLAAGFIAMMGFRIERIRREAEARAREVEQRRITEERLTVLLHEVNHRVRNMLTVFQAIVSQSLRPGLSLAEAKASLTGRLHAMAHAVNLVTSDDWRGARIADLFRKELMPVGDRIDASGPDLILNVKAAQTLSLALYELATNAAKHGALSHPAGRVDVSWAAIGTGDEARFRLVWREQGGPEVQAPEPTGGGFGRRLVERLVPRDLDGEASLRFLPGGLVYEFEAPLHELTEEKTYLGGRVADRPNELAA